MTPDSMKTAQANQPPMSNDTRKEEMTMWTCRSHPVDSWHEVGCPHCTWTAEQLQTALVAQKANNTALFARVFKLEKELEEAVEEVSKANRRLGHIEGFYGIRMDALQTFQKGLPEPYRTALCDILANGSTPHSPKENPLATERKER